MQMGPFSHEMVLRTINKSVHLAGDRTNPCFVRFFGSTSIFIGVNSWRTHAERQPKTTHVSLFACITRMEKLKVIRHTGII